MKITTEFIWETITRWIEDKVPMDGHQWVDAAAKLNVLLYQEQDRLCVMEQELAKARQMRIEAGDSPPKSKAWCETTDLHREIRRLKAKIERVEETIKIAKVQARLKDMEHRLQ